MKKKVKLMCLAGIILLGLILLSSLILLNNSSEEEFCFVEDDKCYPENICEFQEDSEGIKYCMGTG
jgi:hypothetical protein